LRLGGWAGLGRLESLTLLGGERLDPEDERVGDLAGGLLALAGSPYLRNLRRLNVDDRGLEPPQVKLVRTALRHLGERVTFSSDPARPGEA
jgi:hypothetical protein